MSKGAPAFMTDEAELTMSADAPAETKSKKATATQFLLRGLAISLPPILTLVILLWVARGINDYIIYPISTAVRFAIALAVEETQPAMNFVSLEDPPPLEFAENRYRVSARLKDDFPKLVQQYRLSQGLTNQEVPPAGLTDISKSPAAAASDIRQHVLRENLDEVYVPIGETAIPYTDYAEVARKLGPRQMPSTATGIYMELVTSRYFKSLFNLSAVAVLVTIVMLYFIGRFVTAKVGKWIVSRFETRVMARLPLVNNVYSSVKQVTDFVFKERAIAYNRVVALEYPRPGVWSIAFVTNDGIADIAAVTGEPMLTVLVATSPMPMTGFTTCVRRRDVIDLNITLDQAFQFCISCGVLIPPQQRATPEMVQDEFARRAGNGALIASVPTAELSAPQTARLNNEHRLHPPTSDGPDAAPSKTFEPPRENG